LVNDVVHCLFVVDYSVNIIKKPETKKFRVNYFAIILL